MLHIVLCFEVFCDLCHVLFSLWLSCASEIIIAVIHFLRTAYVKHLRLMFDSAGNTAISIGNCRDATIRARIMMRDAESPMAEARGSHGGMIYLEHH